MESIQQGSNASNSGGNQTESAHLVLSRREGQTLILRPLGIPSEFDVTLNVVELRNGVVRIGIRAVRDINIMRGELESVEAKPSRLGKAWAHFQSHDLSK